MLTEGPIFANNCGHGGYVCSFYIWKKGMEREYYDLYIFDSKSFGQEVCIRYGNGDPEYISPGSVTEFVTRKLRGEPHDSAIELLRQKGKFEWKPSTSN